MKTEHLQQTIPSLGQIFPTNFAPAPIIITAGSAYVDIDVLASSIAYYELLKSLGYDVVICHTGPFNGTIPPYLAERAAPFVKTTPPSQLDHVSYVLVDVSDPNHFEEFVDPTRILKIFDHHFGFETYWPQKIGTNALIKSIGACATLIWQEYEKHPNVEISTFSAKLLATAILSNTLNLQASVTTEADCISLKILEKKAKLSPQWREKYYEETKEFLLNNPQKAMSTDTKQVRFQDNVISFCQIEAWNGEELISDIPFKHLASDLFKEQSWLLSLIDVSAGKNWLITNDEALAKFLLSSLALEKTGDWFVSNKLWLRKEILKLWQ